MCFPQLKWRPIVSALASYLGSFCTRDYTQSFLMASRQTHQIKKKEGKVETFPPEHLLPVFWGHVEDFSSCVNIHQLHVPFSVIIHEIKQQRLRPHISHGFTCHMQDKHGGVSSGKKYEWKHKRCRSNNCICWIIQKLLVFAQLDKRKQWYADVEKSWTAVAS